MSEEYDPQPIAEPEPHDEDWYEEDFMPPVRTQFQELNALAVASVVFAALSILTTFSWIMAIFPVTGISLALVAMYQIKRKPEEYIGRGFAVTALWLSIGLGVIGFTFFLWGQRRIPHGYEVVSFAILKPDDEKGERVPEIATKLSKDKKKVFITGYIYPSRKYMGLKEFLLVPTAADCKFCQQDLRSTGIIRVKLEGDLKIHYQSSLIGIGGLLEIDEEQAAHPFGGVAYQINADCVRK